MLASILLCGIFYLELRHLPDGGPLLPDPAALRRPQHPVPEQRRQQRVTPVSGHRSRQLLPSSGISHLQFWAGKTHVMMLTICYLC